MAKKIILLVVVLVLIGGGFFYWWQIQADIRELNKTLPEGVRVVKSLFGNEYKVVNKVDGYELKIPPEWMGIKEIGYIPERTEEGYTATSIGIEGKEGIGRSVGIDRYKSGRDVGDLGSWAKTNFETFGLMGDFIKDKTGEFDSIKTQENVHFGGEYIYFFKKDFVIYTITGGSEDFIRYIITNGKW